MSLTQEPNSREKMKWSALSHMQSFMAWDEGCTGPLIEVLPDMTVETRLIPQTKIRVFLEREQNVLQPKSNKVHL